MSVVHPTARMLVELSKAQDIEAGDGTTTVVVIAGALLDAAQTLLQKGIHPTTISDAFQAAAVEAEKILVGMSSPVDLSNDELLVKMATTSLNSKVVSQHSWLLAPMAVNAVKRIIDPARDTSVNLKMIKIIKKMGDTVEESEMIDGALIDQKTMGRGGPTRVEKAKIGLIQFQLSPPKTDMENQVIISDYTQMDRALKEERQYILDLCKQIKKAGCNVLLIQKSILRDAVNELSLHFLAKMKIMVVKDIEREDIEFYSKVRKLCQRLQLQCRELRERNHLSRIRTSLKAFATGILVLCYKVRISQLICYYPNIIAAKAVADAVRTSLGPRGMNKMIQSGNGDVTITNDGATILNQMSVVHPTARMLVELSKAQDIEAGDGTTTVVVIAGALLDAAQTLLQKGIHPTTISDAFQAAAVEAEKILVGMSSPVDLSNDELLVKMATTSLNSKVVSQHSWLLAPMAVNAVKRIIDPARDTSVNLKMIKIIKKMGDTVEESEMIDGALIDQKTMGRGA
ncbi:TCP-1/Cpn60 chaperonin family protein [Oesophagostomum dentatum]|uniref:T-complex protein 1 subunit delta n=1 Tax=Oesophagostomum dentatum TaxID=61180 RepID=A0A0B1SYX6_OESDE|nr:TCP-1/Cpn60 chaperonin family protein [Oesophagostomum dentatum]